MAEEQPKAEPKLIPIPVFDDTPADTPKFMVVGDTFVAQTTEGEMLVSLSIPRKVIPEMEDLPVLEQLEALLRSRGDQEMLDRIGELDIIDARELAMKFFQAFGEKSQARLGESFSSST